MPKDPPGRVAPEDSIRPSLLQPVTAGFLAAIVGFGSAFPIVLQGLAGVGASPAQAASGLLALCVVTGLLGAAHSIATRQPISIAWSTPGAALLITTGVPQGGFPAAVGAFMVAALLVVAAGLWRPFGRAVVAIPMSLASAMLGGVLLSLCLAPVRAVGAAPELALPIVIVWALGWRFVRLYAVPLAVLVTAAIVVFATPMPAGALADIWPKPVFVAPEFSMAAVVSIAVPLFIVTMASQNVPGLAVMRGNGYHPQVQGKRIWSLRLLKADGASWRSGAINSDRGCQNGEEPASVRSFARSKGSSASNHLPNFSYAIALPRSKPGLHLDRAVQRRHRPVRRPRGEP